MDNAFLEYFKNFTFLNLEDLKAIYSLSRIKTVQKGEVIIEAGQTTYDVFIVLKGLLRSYTTTIHGEEITLAFALKGMEMASPESILGDKPALASLDALETSLVLIINHQKFESLSKRHHGLVNFQLQTLKKTLLMATARIIFYTALSPEERFLHIQEHQPELIQRVPQKYLASYIGVTTVSLSRMKARITNRKK